MQNMLLLLLFTTYAAFSLSFELYQAKLATQGAAFPLISSSLTCVMNFELDVQLL